MILPLLINGFTFFIGLITLKYSFKSLNLYLNISNISTSKIRSIAAGTIEVKGEVFPLDEENILISPLTKTKSCAYNLKVLEIIKRKNKTETKIIYQTIQCIPFYIKEEDKYILVEPNGAKIYNDSYTKKKVLETDNLLKNIPIFNINREYIYEENVVPVNEKVFIIGQTIENSNSFGNINRLKISKVKSKEFIITDESEDKLKKRVLINTFFLFSFTIFLLFFSLIQIINIIDWIIYLGD